MSLCCIGSCMCRSEEQLWWVDLLECMCKGEHAASTARIWCDIPLSCCNAAHQQAHMPLNVQQVLSVMTALVTKVFGPYNDFFYGKCFDSGKHCLYPKEFWFFFLSSFFRQPCFMKCPYHKKLLTVPDSASKQLIAAWSQCMHCLVVWWLVKIDAVLLFVLSSCVCGPVDAVQFSKSIMRTWRDSVHLHTNGRFAWRPWVTHARREMGQLL